MRKRFVAPVLRAEVTLAALTQGGIRPLSCVDICSDAFNP